MSELNEEGIKVEPKQSALNRYIPTLDGWRALAISLVILGHNQPRIPASLSPLGQFSGQAVDLFFALSGFLICRRLLNEEEKTGHISLKGFYIRRAFRLQPAALTYLLTMALLSVIGFIPLHWHEWFAAMFAFYSFIPDPADYPHWFTGHFWSLAAEEQFYLFLPALLVLVRRRRLALLAVITVLLEVWHVVALHFPVLLNAGQRVRRTDMVLGSITLGCVAAFLVTKPRVLEFMKLWIKPWVAILYASGIEALALTQRLNRQHILLITIYPVLLLATMLNPTAILSRFLELRPLRFLGRISYSLYLWQQLFFRTSFIPPIGVRANGWLCLAGAVIMAVFSFYCIEGPMNRLGHRLASRYSGTRSVLKHPEPIANRLL